MADAWGNWIALGALAVSGYALIAGEVRARRRRRQSVQRNIVEWNVRWTDETTVSLINLGPDEACDVYVKFTANYLKSTATTRSLRPGQALPIDVASNAFVRAAWNRELVHPKGMRIPHFSYGIVVSWHYRNGPRDQWSIEAPMFKLDAF